MNGRFAPSPTGTLHLGNLRTGLLAWLFARSAESAFLAFLFYVPFPYSRSSNVKNFKVLPTGYYHLEDVSL